MSSLVPDNWATDERTRNVVMISALLLDYEPFWGTEKTKNWFNRLSNLVHKFDRLLKDANSMGEHKMFNIWTHFHICYMKGQIYVTWTVQSIIWKAKSMIYIKGQICYMKGQIYVIWNPNLHNMKGQIYVKSMLYEWPSLLYEWPNLCYMNGQIYAIWKAKSVVWKAKSMLMEG